jgi:hypothetical protein
MGDTDVSHLLRRFGLGANVDVMCGGPNDELLAEQMRIAWSRCLVDEPVAGALSGEPVDVSGPVHAASLASVLMRTTQLITHALIKAQAGGSSCSMRGP